MDLLHQRSFRLIALAVACLVLHTYGFLGSTYSAKQWALRDDRHRLFKGATYLGVLPLRVLFSLFSAFVATLVWAVVIGAFYLMAHVMTAH